MKVGRSLDEDVRCGRYLVPEAPGYSTGPEAHHEVNPRLGALARGANGGLSLGLRQAV
jgi:hypothetical protein